MKLRVDLHSHTNLDPDHSPRGDGTVTYSYLDALDVAKKEGIDVLSFTHHRKIIFTKTMVAQAKKRGILLLSGVEAVIEGKDVILINPTTDKIFTFEQLATERRNNPNLFVLAPHPFYPSTHSLGLQLLSNIKLFDAIEYCHFYTSWMNIFNWIAVWVANSNAKSIVGTSDSHHLQTFGLTSTIIECKNTSSFPSSSQVILALKKPSSCKVKTRPISFSYFLQVVCNVTRISGFFKNSKNRK